MCSSDLHEAVRASYGTPTRSTIVSGRIIGRKDSVCAHTDVTSITGFSGWHNDPPAARLYAVEPVGVETQIPSASTDVKCSSSPNISVYDIAAPAVSCLQLLYPIDACTYLDSGHDRRPLR